MSHFSRKPFITFCLKIYSYQLKVLETFSKKLEEHNPDGDCKPIFGGDFNLIFDTILDISGGNPTLKKKSLAKILKIIDKLDAFVLDFLTKCN